MAWTLTEIYRQPGFVGYHVNTSAAPDTVVVIPHALGDYPIFVNLLPHNAAAVDAGFWVDTFTPEEITLHKSGGLGVGAEVHLTLWTLRINPWPADTVRIVDST